MERGENDLKKWKRKSVVIVVILFVGINLFLLLKDESKVARTSFLNDWSRVKIDDVTKTFETNGVAVPESEYYIYNDEEKGQISSVLVQKGDVVKEGTSLLSYGSTSLIDEKTNIESEIKMIESEISAVTSQIADLKRIVPSESVSTTTTTDNSREISLYVDMSPVVESDIAQAVTSAEGELEKLEAKLEKFNTTLKQIEKQLKERSVSSEIEGQVIEVNKDGQSPIITIASMPVKVEGILSEKEIMEAAEGNPVHLHSELHDKKYEGEISKIMKYPTEQPGLDSDVSYSFEVTLNEYDEALLAGSKLIMKIVVDEVTDVLVVPTKATFLSGKEDYIYRLTDSGKIEKQAITKGLSFEGEVEVKEGLQGGEMIVVNKKDVAQVNSTFITPIKTIDLKKKEFKKLSKKQYAKYILMGLLER